MFFAPPKVKSLSRYADFGIYLGQKYFFIMLAIAITIHATVITIFALMPKEEVMRIPVRVLNIKLSGGVHMDVPFIPVPTPAGGGAPAIEKFPAAHAAEKTTAHTSKPVTPKPVSVKPSEHPKVVQAEKKIGNLAAGEASAEPNLATPKRYIRESDAGNGTGTGQGAGTGTGKGSEEAIQRYEQSLSIWIASHKTYPEAAKQQGVEGDAIVRIRISRDGHILYNAIDRSSGNALIDQAVTAMVRASEPVPAVPLDYPDHNLQLEFLVPVSFRLQ